MPFPDALLAHVRPARSPGFAKQLCALTGGDPWEHSNLPEEKGLERWIGGLARFGKAAYVRAAAAAAQHAYPQALERSAGDDSGMALAEDAESADGEPAGKQVARVVAWLAAPSPESAAAVAGSIDPSRQLNIWDEDLYPPLDTSWWWFLEVGQLCAMAAAAPEQGAGDPALPEPYGWTGPVAAARAAVCALKSMRLPDGSVPADVEALAGAIAKAFG